MKEKDPFEYLTAEELKEEFPYPAKFYNWTTHSLKVVGYMGIINVKFNNSIKTFVFQRNSVVKYVRYVISKNGDFNNNLSDSIK